MPETPTQARKDETIEIRPKAPVLNAKIGNDVQPCCLRTVDVLAAHNIMMACPECKQIIKTFKDVKKYENYRLFCESRGRVIQSAVYKDQYVIAFFSYDA